MAPALVGLAIFAFWPMVEGVRVSLFDHNLFTGEETWVGGGNYLDAFADPVFWRSVVVTALFFVLFVPVRMMAAMGLAVVFWRATRANKALRVLILIPTVTSLVVVSVLWGIIYQSEIGLANGVLTTLGLPPQPFLTSTTQALPSIAAMMVWKEVGFSMIFYLAGLTAIPPQLLEAAEIDGASRWQRFRHVTFPLLKGTHYFVLITSTLFAFKVFTPVYLMTGGGPSGSTRMIVLYIFESAFRFNRSSYAAALSVILAVFLLAVTVALLRVSRDRAW